MASANLQTQAIYLVKTNGRIFGPLETVQIGQMIAYGNINAFDEVKVPLGPWKFIRDEAVLFQYLKTLDADSVKSEQTQISTTREVTEVGEHTPPPLKKTTSMGLDSLSNIENVKSQKLTLKPFTLLKGLVASAVFGVCLFLGMSLLKEPEAVSVPNRVKSPILDLALEAFNKKQYDTAVDLFKTQELSSDPQFRIPFLALMFNQPYLVTGLQSAINDSFDLPMSDKQRYELQLLKFKLALREKNLNAAHTTLSEMKRQSFQDWRLDFNQKLLKSSETEYSVELDKNIKSEWAFLWFKINKDKDPAAKLDFLLNQSQLNEPGRLHFQVYLIVELLKQQQAQKATKAWTSLRDQSWPDEDKILSLDPFIEADLWSWSGEIYENCQKVSQISNEKWIPFLVSFCQYKAGDTAKAKLTLLSEEAKPYYKTEAQSFTMFLKFKEGSLSEAYEGSMNCDNFICRVLQTEKLINSGQYQKAQVSLENWPIYSGAEAVKQNLLFRIGDRVE